MIGSKLKEYRQMLDLTGATLANLAGINQPYLSKIENEKTIPPFDTFMNLVNAMAHILPINRDNEYYVLTDDGYDEFSKLLKIDIKFIHDEKNEYIIHVFFENNEIFYRREEYEEDGYIPDKNDLLADEISEKYFDWRSEISKYNLLELESRKSEFPLAYYDENVIQELYVFWYNWILGDIFYSVTSDDAPMILDSEMDLVLQVGALRNQEGEFSPGESDDSTNITKDLLNGKTVIFDLKSVTDKNIRALLDGQLLSNDELEAIKFTLNGIRYNRQQK